MAGILGYQFYWTPSVYIFCASGKRTVVITQHRKTHLLNVEFTYKGLYIVSRLFLQLHLLLATSQDLDCCRTRWTWSHVDPWQCQHRFSDINAVGQMPTRSKKGPSQMSKKVLHMCRRRRSFRTETDCRWWTSKKRAGARRVAAKWSHDGYIDSLLALDAIFLPELTSSIMLPAYPLKSNRFSMDQISLEETLEPWLTCFWVTVCLATGCRTLKRCVLSLTFTCYLPIKGHSNITGTKYSMTSLLTHQDTCAHMQ